jgi:hypothetical protein
VFGRRPTNRIVLPIRRIEVGSYLAEKKLQATQIEPCDGAGRLRSRYPAQKLCRNGSARAKFT